MEFHHVCQLAGCGQEFVSARSHRKYCCDAHRLAAFRASREKPVAKSKAMSKEEAVVLLRSWGVQMPKVEGPPSHRELVSAALARVAVMQRTKRRPDRLLSEGGAPDSWGVWSD